MPGGESTTMSILLESSGLFDPIAKRLADGLPVFGTCAGMILLAAEVLDGRRDQRSFGAIDLAVRRNAYGRQVDSFETDLAVPELGDPPFHAVFIRAPRVERVGPDVEVLAEHDGRAVLARQGPSPWPSFHPELSGDTAAPRPLPRGGHVAMSGHSKWATIKHQKGAKDKARGKLFAKLIRQVEVAAREGGGDIDVQRHAAHDGAPRPRRRRCPTTPSTAPSSGARASCEGVTYESITYEGYAPGGVALLIDVLTDNRNRTGAEVRNIFSKLGGSMAEPGAVGWQFSPHGRDPGAPVGHEDDVMMAALDAGAEDIVDDGDDVAGHVRAAAPSRRCARRSRPPGSRCTSAESTMVSSTTIEVDRRRRRPRRCCASWTRSRTTTTCRTCTRTSTSPTTSSQSVEA